MNGFPCKNPSSVQAKDFSFSGLHVSGNASNPLGSKVTPVTVLQIPGLNTLGISVYSPFGLFAGWGQPAPHPPSCNGNFHKGLVHFQRNKGTGNAVAIAGLSSQSPGVITVANSVFGSNPKIPNDLLAKAFQVDTKTVDSIMSKF
ncbi:hypothetical protein SASPL_154069 [Salvia splendens]|uniref:Cupin type-1 domain-containing protein n=1 Tax=Salvia splendens TaxID=180675 RepID=A0A8X8VZN8_SALSN|nr:hypothetical protein SASPL_154069 [Salvia splendens]